MYPFHSIFSSIFNLMSILFSLTIFSPPTLYIMSECGWLDSSEIRVRGIGIMIHASEPPRDDQIRASETTLGNHPPLPGHVHIYIQRAKSPTGWPVRNHLYSCSKGGISDSIVMIGSTNFFRGLVRSIQNVCTASFQIPASPNCPL